MDKTLLKLLESYGFSYDGPDLTGIFEDTLSGEIVILLVKMEAEEYFGREVMRFYQNDGSESFSLDQFISWAGHSLRPLNAKTYKIQFMCSVSFEVDTKQAFLNGEASNYDYETAEDLANQIARERLNEIAEDLRQNPEWKIEVEEAKQFGIIRREV
jgi:hypothetical protein